MLPSKVAGSHPQLPGWFCPQTDTRPDFVDESLIASLRHNCQPWFMPTVLRIGPYRFHFYSREGNEPPHIHVTREEMEAKFWLRPVVLASNHGFAKAELVRIEQLVDEHCQKLLEAYIQTHGR
jgi:hypothetical protein